MPKRPLRDSSDAYPPQGIDRQKFFDRPFPGEMLSPFSLVNLIWSSSNLTPDQIGKLAGILSNPDNAGLRKRIADASQIQDKEQKKDYIDRVLWDIAE